ncbi:Sensor histidine kinase YehU [Tepidimonas thermarum]|uniref:Sensor histidine kinase YehU n=2 Tax=Tepidimonas thermarum TaxID=335431 RepID=A0A554X2U2_9BURK|nr:Sensor histidine kinase YehU [Tepidimonas thermarum]
MTALHFVRTSSLATRVVVVLAFNTLIASLLPRTSGQGFAQNLLYAQLIGLAIWALIDAGRRVLFRRRRGWDGAVPMVIWVLVAVPLGYAGGSIAADLLLGHPALRSWHAAPELTLRMLLISLAAGGAAAYVFASREMLARARLDEAHARQQASEARLKLLESQLEPHMLFNTLANLRALVTVDPGAAQVMIDHLNNYLRATLSGSRAAWHPLAVEFDRLRDYLELMRVRMGSRLAFDLSLPEDMRAIPVPPLLLQPLVENAIVHGLEPSVTGGSIEVQARRGVDAQGGAWLLLDVRDTGARLHADVPVQTFAGFGLTQVRERLATCYGPSATLDLVAEPGQFTRASLRIPLQNA